MSIIIIIVILLLLCPFAYIFNNNLLNKGKNYGNNNLHMYLDYVTAYELTIGTTDLLVRAWYQDPIIINNFISTATIQQTLSSIDTWLSNITIGLTGLTIFLLLYIDLWNKGSINDPSTPLGKKQKEYLKLKNRIKNNRIKLNNEKIQMGVDIRKKWRLAFHIVSQVAGVIIIPLLFALILCAALEF